MKYQTIVADPPWEYEGFASQSVTRGKWRGPVNHKKPLPYPSLTTDEIKQLPIRSFTESNCRLFLWTTNRYLPAAFDILSSWGFRYRQTLIWHKRGANLGGSVAPCSVEFLLVGIMGAPAVLTKWATAIMTTAAPKKHSQKPDVFGDLIETVSPGPYLEMFARRQRLGWDTWGDECFDPS